jgi:hypothetical protein
MEEGLCLAQYESFDLNTDEARRRNEWMNEWMPAPDSDGFKF